MERVAWTDERMDDLVAGMNRHFDLLHQEIREMRVESRGEFRAVRGELLATQRQMTQIGWTMVGTLAAALVALVATIAVALL